MNKNFVEAIVNEIKSIVGENTKVDVREVVKNNGLKLTGVTVMRENENIAPTVYLDNYSEDDDVEAIARDIIETLEKARNITPVIDIESIKNFDNIKDKLVVRLVNYKTNEDILSTMPHIKYLDLAIICCINICDDGTIKVTNQFLETWETSRDELFDIAMKNTPNVLPVDGRNMFEYMDELMGGEKVYHEGLDVFDASFMNLYLLSNTEKLFGSSTILYDGVLETLAAQANSDLVLIPSSVHEWLIMPYDSSMDMDVLMGMICDVNATEVKQDETLSDHPYIYRRYTKQVEIEN